MHQVLAFHAHCWYRGRPRRGTVDYHVSGGSSTLVQKAKRPSPRGRDDGQFMRRSSNPTYTAVHPPEIRIRMVSPNPRLHVSHLLHLWQYTDQSAYSALRKCQKESHHL